MLLFFDLGDENSEFFLKEKWTHEGVQLLAKRFVPVRIRQGSRDLWKRYGLETGPAIRLVDQNGVLLEKGWWRSATALHGAMKEALRKFGPILAPGVRVRADEISAEIEAAMRAKEYVKALEAARRLEALTGENPYAERVRVTRKQVGEHARVLLEQLEAREKAGRLYEALRGYRDIATRFAGTAAAERASAHVTRFEKSASLMAAVEEQRREAEAADALARADKLDAMRPDKALEMWDRIVADWPGTEAAHTAEELARERRADPRQMARVREAAAAQVCPARLSLAKSYADSGMVGEARKLLESILAEHPDSSFAPKARAMLEELKGR
jgi:tetratricopeptide (TPR) repeat protein